MNKTMLQCLKNKSFMEIIRYIKEYIETKKVTYRLSRTVLSENGTSKNERDVKIVVSLTSFPGRINTVHQCIKTILNQSLKPDKVVLWLAVEQFENKENDLPFQLLELKDYGLEILWCHDNRSYKKLIPAIKTFPNSIIVTADDDLYYDENWLELLYQGYVDYPKCIQCHRGSKLIRNNGQWAFIVGGRDIYDHPSYLNKLVGCGGVLYPPGCLHQDVLREDLFMKLAPSNDDIWFWLMGVLAGTKIRTVEGRIMWNKEIRGTRQTGLCQNLNSDDVILEQMNNVLKAYPMIENSLISEWSIIN